ncbi:MAG: hypothetical protein KatS3mg052_2151 [Candidatus Roseilinea sp.]|nr:MAG: hypothetical protein KatS3mg052_2151 [Candidatus Roseilinea sp.]
MRRALAALERELDESGVVLVPHVWARVQARAPDVGKALYGVDERIVSRLERRQRGALAQIALQRSNLWERYVPDRRRAEAPATNNRVERMIGRIRQRLVGMRRVKRVARPERAMGLSFVQLA